MYSFLHKKEINFLLKVLFKICKMYTFDQYFLARNHERINNKIVDYFFYQLVLHILCKHFVQ